MNYVMLVLVLVVLVLGFFIYRLSVGKKLSPENLKKYSTKILATKKLDPAHAIMESHKLFVAAIGTMLSDKKLTAAQKIARVQKKFPNHKQIWRHHKLRNRVAHQPDVKVLSVQAELARKDFVRALNSLG